MVYYLATGDITRGDVHVYANYADNDPELGWKMQRVLDQANAAQRNHGDPTSPNYIPNYNVIVSTNGAGFNMATGEPGGLLVMNGKEYHGIDGSGFFGICTVVFRQTVTQFRGETAFDKFLTYQTAAAVPLAEKFYAIFRQKMIIYIMILTAFFYSFINLILRIGGTEQFVF
jgi:hypothetical protein